MDNGSVKNYKHDVTMLCRSSLFITGVNEVVSFDEENIILVCDSACLSIDGEGLHIVKLSTDSGEISIEGRVDSLIYSDDTKKVQDGIFSRLFGRKS